MLSDLYSPTFDTLMAFILEKYSRLCETNERRSCLEISFRFKINKVLEDDSQVKVYSEAFIGENSHSFFENKVASEKYEELVRDAVSEVREIVRKSDFTKSNGLDFSMNRRANLKSVSLSGTVSRLSIQGRISGLVEIICSTI